MEIVRLSLFPFCFAGKSEITSIFEKCLKIVVNNARNRFIAFKRNLQMSWIVNCVKNRDFKCEKWKSLLICALCFQILKDGSTFDPS